MDPSAQYNQQLAALRQTLGHLLRQATHYGGEVLVPPQVAAMLGETRAAIARTKAALRTVGVIVDDQEGELAPAVPAAPPPGLPPLVNHGVIGVYGVNQGTVVVQAAPEPPPAPTPARPPTISGFVGRQAELARYSTQLAHQHLVVISGMAGVGKTSLAVMLVSSSTIPVFWHSFHPDEGLDGVVWRLAAFLAHQGRAELWRMLTTARQHGGQPPPLATTLDYLLQQLQDVLLVFDDLHHVEGDPQVETLLARLRPASTAGMLKLLITTRSHSGLANSTTPPLAGLTQADSTQLLAARGLLLPTALANELHTITAGNAQLLTLAINVLQQATDQASVIAHLAGADDIERYLLHEVDAHLSDAERAVLSSLAVLQTPASHDAIEALLDGQRVRRAIDGLTARYLLRTSRSSHGDEYQLHTMVATFAYAQLSRRERRSLHLRAGEYYAEAGDAPLRAAQHLALADEPGRAVRMATSALWVIINSGQARPLQSLLTQLAQTQLGVAERVALQLALGEVLALLGESAPAQAAFEAALATLTGLPEAALLEARACRGLGDLFKQREPRVALAWYARGSAALQGQHPGEQAALEIAVGIAHRNLGELDAAQSALTNGLAHLLPGASQLRARALTNLASVHFRHGQLASAVAAVQEAMAIATALDDQFQVAYASNNLGIYQFTAGNWHAAVDAWQQALNLAETLGSAQVASQIENNLGIVAAYLGDEPNEERHLLRSIERAQQMQASANVVTGQIGLAELRLRQARFADCAELLHSSTGLLEKLDSQDGIAEIARIWAEWHLAQGQLTAALAAAQHAVALAANESDQSASYGICLRVLARCQATLGDLPAAGASISQSLAILEPQDRYEAERSRVVWGEILLASGDMGQASDALEQAHTAFAALGARRDQAQAAALLGQ